MSRTITLILGFLLLVLGILGFVPSLYKDGLLFGYFHLNTAHNLLHIITGLIALWCAFTSGCLTSLFLKVFGLLYLLAGIWGFFSEESLLLGIFANNRADNILHLVIGAVAAYFGFFRCCNSHCKK